MYKKINVYINGVYEFSTNRYRTCKDCIRTLRATKHIEVASIPTRFLTIYDYDTIRATYAR